MIILDTNVVSEPLKPAPNPVVVDWLNAQAPATLFITSINLAELLAVVANHAARQTAGRFGASLVHPCERTL
jgi:predicted nucleic acid-binding protein